MKKILYNILTLGAVMFLWLSAFAHAADESGLKSYEISPGIQLQMNIPNESWTVTKSAPQYLVDEAVEDVKNDLQSAGKTATDDQIKTRVDKQLSSNELYVYNPESKATLQIDFSPLEEGESPPSKKTVKASAVAAGESMASEGGVSGSAYHVSAAQIKDVETAYRLDLDFKVDDAPRKFIGLIGYDFRNWMFFYYTDRLATPSDYTQMEQLLANITVQSFANLLAEGKEAFAKKDYPTALQSFSPLADQGSAEALYYIGFMHMKGYGVPQDHKVAAEWYEKAAEMGSVPAQNKLGFVYAKGDHGLEQDYTTAAKWYRMAAENGDVAAQFNIGRMYLEGTGVSKDPVMAYAFSAWSVEGGDDNAKELRDRAEKEMTAEQLKQAKQKLDELKGRGKLP